MTCRHLKEPEAVLESILKSKVSVLPGHIQAVFIHNLMKLYAHILNKASTPDEKEKAQTVLPTFPFSCHSSRSMIFSKIF